MKDVWSCGPTLSCTLAGSGCPESESVTNHDDTNQGDCRFQAKCSSAAWSSQGDSMSDSQQDSEIHQKVIVTVTRRC